MPNCSVVGCGIKKTENLPNVSLHRLPKNDRKRKMWLDIIGRENLKTHTKSIFVCSLHFEESSFNHTLINTVLRDDAVPSHIFLPSALFNSSVALTEMDQSQTPSTAKHDASDKQLLATDKTTLDENVPPDVPTSSKQGFLFKENRARLAPHRKKLHTNESLLKTCAALRKKIKILNERVRRQKKQIINLKDKLRNSKKTK